MQFYRKELFVKGSKNIFVFGSNGRGKHGKGAALFAKQHCGAVYGQAVGLQGNSYAIPTKDEFFNPIPLNIIYNNYVIPFLRFADANKQLTFYLTPIGTGLAGYTHIQIAPMFVDAPNNVILPPVWNLRTEIPLLEGVDKA